MKSLWNLKKYIRAKSGGDLLSFAFCCYTWINFTYIITMSDLLKNISSLACHDIWWWIDLVTNISPITTISSQALVVKFPTTIFNRHKVSNYFLKLSNIIYICYIFIIFVRQKNKKLEMFIVEMRDFIWCKKLEFLTQMGEYIRKFETMHFWKKLL